MKKEIEIPEDLEAENLSKQLKHIVQQAGIKQSHIAKKLGISRGAVHYMLNNDAKNPRSAKKLLNLLGLDPKELLSKEKKLDIEQKVTKNVSIQTELQNTPLYYIDQIALLKQGVGEINPIGYVILQKDYGPESFAIQISTPSVFQKFEAGDIVAFRPKEQINIGDWILVYSASELKPFFGLVVAKETDKLTIAHNKLETPLVINLAVDQVFGAFVELIRFAK